MWQFGNKQGIMLILLFWFEILWSMEEDWNWVTRCKPQAANLVRQ